MPPPNNKSTMMNTRPGRIDGDSDESETPSNNLWVGNLASDVADSDLMDLFAQYGALDSFTSYSSRSYAFIFFKRIEVAKAAKDTLQGADLHGHPIKIEFARPPRTYDINKNPMKKVTNPQSIKANKIPNIKDMNPVGVIYTTTTSVKDRRRQRRRGTINHQDNHKSQS
ncbi:hypothetical protein ACB092_01G180500 [Castanea dentata]